MNLDQEVSERIELLRFPLIVGVVFIHAFPVVAPMGIKMGAVDPHSFHLLIRNLFSEVFARISVPMLFAISAFLFFQGLERGAQSEISLRYFLKKWKSRIRTLVIPFLFWNAVGILAMLALQHSPIAHFFSGTARIDEFGPWNYLNSLLGITHAPMAYQFWFVRNLILFTALTPLFFLALRCMPHVWLAMIGALWLLKLWPLRIPDSTGMFFFSLGAYFALWPVNLRALDRVFWRLGGLYAFLATMDLTHKTEWFSGRLHNLTNFAGVLFAFVLTQKIMGKEFLRGPLLALAPASFFVFAFHEPLLTILRKTTYSWLWPLGNLGIITLYFLNPVIIIGIGVILYRVLVHQAPRFTGWITGGR